MKKLLLLTTFLCGASVPALAQTATATGTGVGVANSRSQSGAIAVNRGNGGNSTINIAPSPSATTSTLNQNVSGTTTSNRNQHITGGTNNRTEVTGTSTVKNVPGTLAPGLTAAGLETCLGSASGGGSIVGFGASFGTTVPDPGCNARLDARTLWSMGLKSAAVARLCIQPDIYRSMPDVCDRYTPAQAPVAVPYNYGYPAPYRAAATGGPIRVVDGRTGIERDCDNYNEAKFKCLQWTGEAARGARTKLATTGPRRTTTGRPVVTATTKPPATATAAIAAATVNDQSK